MLTCLDKFYWLHRQLYDLFDMIKINALPFRWGLLDVRQFSIKARTIHNLSVDIDASDPKFLLMIHKEE